MITRWARDGGDENGAARRAGRSWPYCRSEGAGNARGRRNQRKPSEGGDDQSGEGSSDGSRIAREGARRRDKTDSAYTSVGKPYPETSTGRRLALARWITQPDNPLTARVAVNHIWLRHFGAPLVENVFDFGLRSPRPAHAELLDWLAVELGRARAGA